MSSSGEIQDSPTIRQGQVQALFAFDIGYEVSLDKVRELLASLPVAPISRKKQTPNYLQYAYRPLSHFMGEIVSLERLFEIDPTDDVALKSNQSMPYAGQIHATIFAFGAVSISYRWPLANPDGSPFPLEKLPELSSRLYQYALESHARMLVENLLRQIKPAVTRPVLSELVEDYYVFIIERFTGDEVTESVSNSYGQKAEKLLKRYPALLAQTLQSENQPLSKDQQEAALAHRISYYEQDLVLIDWNATIIFDSDFRDTLNVLELLNVELLEARYMDALLDRRLKSYEKLIQHPPQKWYMPLYIPYRQAINELAELRIEASLLEERTHNSLKLIGDLYLARVYSTASDQFYLPTWDTSITRKLDIIANLYQLLTDRVNTSQGQTLELIIIILILIEIALNLFFHP